MPTVPIVSARASPPPPAGSTPAGWNPGLTDEIPVAGRIASMLTLEVTVTAIAYCITAKAAHFRDWRVVPPSLWFVLGINLCSLVFAVSSSILVRGLLINQDIIVCEASAILCLTCYLSSKVLTYLFLAERSHIVRGALGPRLRDHRYLINLGLILVLSMPVISLNLYYRIAYIREDGVCIIGMRDRSLIPLIGFELAVNTYLTTLFIIPLRRLYSYRRNRHSPLRQLVIRSFIGSCLMLVVSVSNMFVMLALGGEPAWICLMVCNCDMLFTVLIIHWITSFDDKRDGTRLSQNPVRGRASFSRSGHQSQTTDTQRSAANDGAGSDVESRKFSTDAVADAGLQLDSWQVPLSEMRTECVPAGPDGGRPGRADELSQTQDSCVLVTHEIRTFALPGSAAATIWQHPFGPDADGLPASAAAAEDEQEEGKGRSGRRDRLDRIEVQVRTEQRRENVGPAPRPSADTARTLSAAHE